MARWAMAKSSVVARVLEGDRLQCKVTTPAGHRLTLSGGTRDTLPSVDELTGPLTRRVAGHRSDHDQRDGATPNPATPLGTRVDFGSVNR
jgi:hypothetical protein